MQNHSATLTGRSCEKQTDSDKNGDCKERWELLENILLRRELDVAIGEGSKTDDDEGASGFCCGRSLLFANNVVPEKFQFEQIRRIQRTAYEVIFKEPIQSRSQHEYKATYQNYQFWLEWQRSVTSGYQLALL